ncbi:MAG: DUF1015 family protein [Fusobacterium sp.]|uniref:DUF1015 family protein n=1 Tax=Fusobacterium sp. TaxID=68766 RepID=UPI003FA020F8
MELSKIKKAYINITGNLYPNDYINLAKVKDGKIAFDEETLFLTEEQKKLLNSESIKEFNDIVIIFCLKNSWGIICNIPIKNYRDKKILSHELVLSDVIQRMISSFHLYNTEVNPVMLTHNTKIDLYKFTKEYTYNFYQNNSELELFVYSGENANKILSYLETIDYFYVADGHHRLYSTSLYTEKKYTMACIYNIDELTIESIPRKINNISNEKYLIFKDKILKKFEMINNKKELEKGEVKLIFNNDELNFKLRNVVGDLFSNNDIYRLNTQLISNIFRVFREEEIIYLSLEELKKELSNKNKDSLYIMTSSMKKEEFLNTVKSNNIMPPKSTYFKPKFPSFLIFNCFKE